MLEQAILEPAPFVPSFTERMKAAKEAKRARQERFPDEGEAFEPSQDPEEPSEALGGDEFPLPVPAAAKPEKPLNQMSIIRRAFMLNQGMTPKELAKLLADQGHDFKLSTIATISADSRSFIREAKALGFWGA